MQCGGGRWYENMSMVPHYLDGRKGTKFGNIQVKDGMILDD